MQVKISFHHMPHSGALENHALHRLEKIETLFKHHDKEEHPIHVDLFLNAQTAHNDHHSAELHIKVASLHHTTHDTGSDMYGIIDSVVQKMVSVIKKEKSKQHDKTHKVKTEKRLFAES